MLISTQSEMDHLLTKLGLDSSHFLGVSCCPEGKGVVYVTLHPSVNIQRFLHKNECFELKEGIRTGIIRPASKKEQSVTISGLHPNIKDQAVVRYLTAHGKVSSTDRVIHHVYPGAPGSSLCAGKLNGNGSYMIEISKPMGSYIRSSNLCKSMLSPRTSIFKYNLWWSQSPSGFASSTDRGTWMVLITQVF